MVIFDFTSLQNYLNSVDPVDGLGLDPSSIRTLHIGDLAWQVGKEINELINYGEFRMQWAVVFWEFILVK